MKMLGSKFRHEMKYIISTGQAEIIRNRLSWICQKDLHADEKGYYNVRSMYFDDYDNQCFYDNESGTDPREKYRIRIYDCLTNYILLECKRKERGMTCKSSSHISATQVSDILECCRGVGNLALINSQSTGVLNKFLANISLRKMRPVVIVDYNRVPFVYPLGNVRVTIDMDISSSMNMKDFFRVDMMRRPIMPSGMQLLEVKWDSFLPDIIYRACSLEHIQRVSYSKYYLCRKYSL